MTTRAVKQTTRVGDMRALLRVSHGLHAHSVATSASPTAPNENGATDGATGGTAGGAMSSDGGVTRAVRRNGNRTGVRSGGESASRAINSSGDHNQSDQSGDRNGDAVHRKRRLIAMFCKMVGEQVVRGDGALPPGVLPPRPPAEPLSPRQRQTLELLLAGNAEKQIAARLDISRHTVHVYVKSLYRCFGVCSRAELLARWVQR
jgi:DNA-binding CsgD family transcriptional regulator